MRLSPLACHRVSISSLALVTTLALTACGTTEEPTAAAGDDGAAGSPDAEAAASGSSTGETAGPITFTDERGEHTLEEPADEVVSLEWGLTENLLTLGVEPIGQADVQGYNTWDTSIALDPETPDVGIRGEPSLSDITALEPDLIVTTTDIPENVISQLEDIAPVLTVLGSDSEDPVGYMESTVELLGQVTGTSDEAEKALSSFDTALAEGRAELAEAGLEGSEFVMADGWLTNGVVSIRMFTPGSYFGAVGEELGMTNAWTEGGDPDYGLAQTDVEGLTALEDVHFLYIANDSEADPFTEGLGDNQIWQQLSFVAAGDVHRLPDGIWMFGGPLSGEAFIDATVEALTE